MSVESLRLIAIAIRYRLVELGLVRAWVDFGKEITFLYSLSLREGDLHDLSGDLTAHDHIVISDHRAYAAQIDRDIAALDGPSDDWHERRRTSCTRRWSIIELLGRKCSTADNDDRHKNYKEMFAHRIDPFSAAGHGYERA